MKKFVGITLAIGLAIGLGLAVDQVGADDHSLVGKTIPEGVGPGTDGDFEAIEALFRGDMVAEMGLGCSNGAGTSGGPNDWAVGVTATLMPPMGLYSTTHNMFTQLGFFTQMAFVVYADSAGVPGAVIGSQALTNAQYQAGTNTITVSPHITLTNQTFFFGLNNPQTNAGGRIGLDTSTAGGPNSFIRAPSCGAATWTALTTIGFPGSWVMRVLVDDTLPVELQAFSVE
ncbi:MAG: hypothetical protein GY906_37880 [bacterium]|nr:hypothetical protein [bacterium]